MGIYEALPSALLRECGALLYQQVQGLKRGEKEGLRVANGEETWFPAHIPRMHWALYANQKKNLGIRAKVFPPLGYKTWAPTSL